MNNVISAILGALAIVYLVLFGKRTGLLDKRNRVDGAGNVNLASTARTTDITDSLDRSQAGVDTAQGAIGSASARLDGALDLIRTIRARGENKDPSANPD